MAGLMFACLSALDEAGLSAIAERMFALVRDPLQKVPHRLAGVRVIINVEKHRFARFKQGVQHSHTSPAVDAGIMPVLEAQQSSETGRSTPGQAEFADVFTRERASELLAILDALTRQADLEPTYLLRASTLAVAIHRLALQEQTWLDQQSARANGNSKRSMNGPTRSVTGPTRASPSRSSSSSMAPDRPIKSRPASDPHDSSTPIRQEKRDISQRNLDERDVRRQPVSDRSSSHFVAVDRFDDDRASHPSWDNDQSFVTITGGDVEPEFSHQELVPTLSFEPPDD